jgi:oligoendopeptidase F
VPVFRPASTVVAGGPETDALPTWDMTVLYPGLDAPEFAEAFAALLDRIAALVRVFDEEGSAGCGRRADGRGRHEVRAGLGELNATLDAYETMNAYLYAFVTTDSRDDAAQARSERAATVGGRHLPR